MIKEYTYLKAAVDSTLGPILDFSKPVGLPLLKILGDIQKTDWDAVPVSDFSEAMQLAMSGTNPENFFRFLMAVGGLPNFLPELAEMSGLKQDKKWHPEEDVFEHIMLVIRQAKAEGLNSNGVLAAALHDIGKELTPTEKQPSYPLHEKLGAEYIQSEKFDKFNIPAEIRSYLADVARYHGQIHSCTNSGSKSLLKMLNEIKGDKGTAYLQDIINVSKADYRGRLYCESLSYPQEDYLLGVNSIIENSRDEYLNINNTRGVSPDLLKLYSDTLTAVNSASSQEEKTTLLNKLDLHWHKIELGLVDNYIAEVLPAIKAEVASHSDFILQKNTENDFSIPDYCHTPMAKKQKCKSVADILLATRCTKAADQADTPVQFNPKLKI
jgi:hypothetical protein